MLLSTADLSYGLHQTFEFFLLEYEISHKTFDEVIDDIDNNSAAE